MSGELRMADGPVRNLPKSMDAYGGYTDDSGIGVTYPDVVKQFPNAIHFSISVHGHAAQCGDVEKGALSSWKGYDYGYCSISNAQRLIDRDGRPRKLWIAHYDSSLGAHICTADDLHRREFGFLDEADGCQWVDHGGQWDESLLKADFFQLVPVPRPAPTPNPTKEDDNVIMRDPVTGGTWVVVPGSGGAIFAYDNAPFLGGTNNPSLNPGNYPCVGIEEFEDPSGYGYELVLDWGDPHGTGHSADGGDRFRRYRFPRSNAGKKVEEITPSEVIGHPNAA